MAGSTGTAERWKTYKNLSSITSTPLLQKLPERLCKSKGQNESCNKILEDEGHPEQGP